MDTDSRTGPCCEYSVKGYCNDGEKCKFAHNTTQTEDQFDNQNHNGTVTGNLTCHFFKAGHCTKGESCRCSHALEGAQESSPNDTEKIGNINNKNDVVSDGRNAEEIRVNIEGEEQCEAQLLAETKARQLEIAEREASVTIRQVVMDGSTLVACGAGLDIQHVVCGFESCFVTIKNLPYNVKRHEIEELITQQGVNIVFFCIVKLQHLSFEVEAKVIADSVYGQHIATNLNGMKFHDKSLYATIDNGGAPNKMGAAEPNANVLRATWKLPTITMVAYYRTSEEAQNAIRKLDNTVFCGRNISAESALSFYTGHISIKITGLAPTVTTDEIQRLSGSYLVKELSLLMFDVEKKLRQIMEQKRAFESFEVSPLNLNESIGEARIRFRTWDDAKRAHDSLKSQTLGQGYPKLCFCLRKVIQYTLTIPLSQYHAQKRRWDLLPAEDRKNSAFVRVTSNGIDKAFICVLGEDKKTVGQLKVRVESLVAGETLDLKLWHRFFLGPAGQRLLEDISAQTKTYVRSDWKSRTLKLYADGDAKQMVINLIRAEIERLEGSESLIYIHRHAIGFFMHKVLPILHEELGEDAVTLELLPTPRLIIRGGEEARRAVDRLIEESRVGIESEIRGSEQNTCPICFDEVTIPIMLTCGHFYCTACLRHFLSSAAERKTFPLVCSGDEDRCKIPIAVPIIQRYLLQQQFDRLVEMAATTYFEKQQTKFKYCTTPECCQIYRCSVGSRMLTCPSCFATVCAGCHNEAHEGMTCRERKIMSDRKEQERLNKWAITAGAKRCPSCQVWIQKTEGCNHMTCHCGTHLCWLCLATFREGQSVYRHMNSVHGGIYGHQGVQIDGDEVRHVDLVQEQANLALAWRLQAEEDAGNVALLHDRIMAQQIQAQWEIEAREPGRVGLHNIEEQRQQRAEQEVQQRAAEQEAQQHDAEQEAQQRAAEQEAQQHDAEQEAQQRAAEQEAQQRAAEQEAQQRATEHEAQQHAAEQEAQQRAAEHEAQQYAAEQEAQQYATEQEPRHMPQSKKPSNVRGIAARVREISEQRAAQGGRWCIIM